MKTKTKAIHSAYQSKDAYGALAMPVYHTDAYEFETVSYTHLTLPTKA